MTNIDGVVQGVFNYSTNPTGITAFYYPDSSTVGSVTGTSSPKFDTGLLDNMTLMVQNGTIYDLTTIANGTYTLSTDFMVYRNYGVLANDNSFGVRFPASSSWNITRYNTYISFTSGADQTNYNITTIYQNNWYITKNATSTFTFMQNKFATYNTLTPLTNAQVTAKWTADLALYDPSAIWQPTYLSATSLTSRLIAVSNPESNYLTSWQTNANGFTSPLNQNGVTIAMYSENTPATVTGATYTYNSATKILTLTATSTTITVSYNL
jgi:hypothetical protein